jgi:hypothetical protein
MFEIHLGENLHIPSEKFKEGFFIAGSPGQGKSTTLLHIALGAIKNKQTGLLIDPYGDLAKTLENHSKSKEAKQQTAFISLDISQKELDVLLKDHFVIAAGDYFEDGNRKTAKKCIKLLKQFYKKKRKEKWLIVDEAFSMIDDDLFDKYMGNNTDGIYSVFSATEFILLSKKERQSFAKQVKNFVIYKPRNINAIKMAEERSILDPKDIKAIKQFHFQLLLGDELSYHKSKYPLDNV